MTGREPPLRRAATGDPPRGVLVTGTDTGVGKTVVSACIAAAWTGAGRRVTYVKPAQSGTDLGDDDARDVARAVPAVDTRTGASFGEPLAPAVAARRAGVGLHLADLVAPVRDAVAAGPADDLVVEGAGGLLVELGTDGTTVADLARELGLPLVVVARLGLGTLNHTALTLAEAARHGLAVAGVVVCRYPAEPDVAEATNLAELAGIARAAGTTLAGVVPDVLAIGPEAFAGAASWLAPGVGGTGSPDPARAHDPGASST